MKLRLRSQVYVLVGALALWAAAPEPPSFAQDAAAAPAKKRKKRKAKKQRDKASAASRGGTPSPPAEPDAAPKPEPKTADKGTSGKGVPAPGTSARDQARQAAQDAAQGVDTAIVKEGDSSVKMMQFSGLDIEGRLKSPQLLYFVNRVRAEFDCPRLPHRSFMPEVERSTRQEPLR